MYFDHNKWHQLAAQEKVIIRGGLVHIMSTAPEMLVWASIEGTDYLLGRGANVRVKISGAALVWVEMPEDAWAQFFDVPVQLHRDAEDAVVFLNGDRVPVEGDEYEGRARLRRLAELIERRELAAAKAEDRRKKEEQRHAEEKEAADKKAADAQEKQNAEMRAMREGKEGVDAAKAE